ncbi:MAG: hypothetical protein GX947_07655 [Tissierellia bacterium]|nr:hypothetical protein [Tissierellia bacterium]
MIIVKDSEKILEMLKKKSVLTFEDIEDELGLVHDDFEEIINAMKNDNLIEIDDTKELIKLK